ncbi:MAG: hypothetical protein IKP17_05295 [Oscillospiraceae bacterium]|nr:hypothetical protein [Oscillospiraceae bacterium]
MFLISSAITKAFHGDHGQYPRYAKPGPEEPGGDVIANLTPAEQRIFINTLMEREQHAGSDSGRRAAPAAYDREHHGLYGSCRSRPMRISDFDKTVLAIHDGELQSFKDLLPQIKNRVGDLLVEAAGRAGAVGRKMTLEIVAYAPEFLSTAYTAASRKAEKIGQSRQYALLRLTLRG